MSRSAEEGWPENQPVDPDASWNNEAIHSAQVGAQVRVIAGLRAMYADLLAESVPAHLLQRIQEVESKQKGSDDDR